jgi:hypothetical protein
VSESAGTAGAGVCACDKEDAATKAMAAKEIKDFFIFQLQFLLRTIYL